MKRRRLVIGLGTLVIGGSGFIASGAVDVGSLGSGGRGWTQVDLADIEEETEEDPAEPDDPDDPEEDEEEEEEHDPGGEIRIQLVTNPDGGGRNRVFRLGNLPQMAQSSLVISDDNGFWDGIDIEAANRRGATRIGGLAGNGVAQPPFAFLIANVGGVGQPDRGGQRVQLRMDLYPTDDPSDPDDAISVDALRMPYFLDSRRRGDDLLGQPIRLSPRQFIGVSVIIDGREDTSQLNRVESIGISVRRIES